VNLDRKNIYRHSSALQDRAAAYAKLGRTVEAIEDLTRVLKRFPLSAPIYAERSKLYDTIGRFHEANVDYRRAVQLNPREGSIDIVALLTLT
jgi:tetratricopeptide (TPR) repeat protein